MGIPIPVHLAVHVLGLAVAAGLVAAALRYRGGHVGRVAVAVGAGLLAASHLLVGGLWAEPAGPVALLRTAGYAAVAVGVAGGRRAEGSPAVAVVALVPSALHVATAVAGLAAAVASARGALGRGATIRPLAAGLALWAAADLLVVTRPAAAAAASLGGSVAVGWWVLAGAGRRSLTGRVTGAFVAVLLVLTVGLAGASGLVFSADLRTEQVERLAAVAAAQAGELGDAAPRELEGIAGLLTGALLTEELLAADAPDALDERAATISELPGVDLVVLVTGEGRVVGSALRGEPLARVDAAALAGDDLVVRALQGASGRGLVRVGEEQLVAVGVSPAAPRDGSGQLELDRRAGVLLVGRPITAPAALDRISRETAADAAVVADGRVLASSMDPATARALRTAPPGEASLDGERRLVARAPLAGADDPAVAELVLALPAGSVADAADTAVRSTFLVAVVGLLVAVGLAVLVGRRMTAPVRELTDAAERIARGEPPAPVATTRADEVGRLAAAFDDMAVALDARETALRDAAATEADLRGQLEAITASMGDALLATGEDGRVLMANPAAARLLGRAVDDLVGRRAATVLPFRVDGGAPLVGALTGPHAATARAEGQGRIVLATAAPLVTDTGPAGRVFVLRDVTDQVRAERLKSEIIANVSHELRTPLTPIRGYLELLRHRDLGPDQVRDFAGHAADAAARLQRTVDALIDLADLEAGRIEAQPQLASVDEVVAALVERWREREPDRRVTRRVARGLPRIEVDVGLLHRALDQLVDNAVKFSSGPVRIAADVADGQVRLRVRDEGVGIPADRLAAVLDDFEQADGSATRHVGGLGLGLSIVQRVLDQLGAGFELDSRPDGGTTAGILLPPAPGEQGP